IQNGAVQVLGTVHQLFLVDGLLELGDLNAISLSDGLIKRLAGNLLRPSIDKENGIRGNTKASYGFSVFSVSLASLVIISDVFKRLASEGQRLVAFFHFLFSVTLKDVRNTLWYC